MNRHTIDKNRWAKMTVFEQMGNIGSEVGRALSAKHRGDMVSMKAALFRGLDLIDITAELWAKKYPYRNKELLRSREFFVQSIVTDNEDTTLEKYFTEFAVAARLHR
ncbi:hypothetical protein HYW36_01020 [Candidatus Saccharibacteria bacterium]|nr:hypothetical protein [Candidatus Saccharibacteria bacterium]